MARPELATAPIEALKPRALTFCLEGAKMSPLSKRGRLTRLSTVAAGVALTLASVTACGDDSAGPEEGAEVENLQTLEDRVEAEAFLGAVDTYLDEQVTVSAEIAEMTVEGDAGAAFMIGAGDEDPIAVIDASPPEGLSESSAVRVTGTVRQIEADTFEQDFGMAADDLFDDAEAWLSENAGELAIAADSVEPISPEELQQEE